MLARLILCWLYRGAAYGPNLDGPGLRDFIRKSADPAKPIAVNVIDFGAGPDRATLKPSYSSAAAATKQEHQSPDLATAVNASS